MQNRKDIYTRVTDRIISDLENGVRTWLKPWSAEHTAGKISRPLRHNGIPYQGNAKRFGDNGYAREELVAELGAAFLSADLGITPEIREDHAVYIGHWLKVLQEDKRAIFSAAAHAQRAADFLQDLQGKEEAEAA